MTYDHCRSLYYINIQQSIGTQTHVHTSALLSDWLFVAFVFFLPLQRRQEISKEDFLKREIFINTHNTVVTSKSQRGEHLVSEAEFSINSN